MVGRGDLMWRGVERGDRLARRVKFAGAEVKRSVDIGGSESLEKGLHFERSEFISSIGQPGAQAAMAGYIEQTAALADLPVYNSATFER